jgi:hypothetical protein
MMKNSKCLLLVFLLLVLGHTRCFAQEKVQGIIVELSSGEVIEYRLVDHPKLVFDGTTVTLTTDGVKVEYKPTELAKVKIGEVANNSSGIEELVTQQGEINVDAGFVRFNGFQFGESVRVFTVSGTLIETYQVSSNGTLTIPISTLPSGISIIKSNKQSIKITLQ